MRHFQLKLRRTYYLVTFNSVVWTIDVFGWRNTDARARRSVFRNRPSRGSVPKRRRVVVLITDADNDFDDLKCFGRTMSHDVDREIAVGLLRADDISVDLLGVSQHSVGFVHLEVPRVIVSLRHNGELHILQDFRFELFTELRIRSDVADERVCWRFLEDTIFQNTVDVHCVHHSNEQ